MITDVKNDKALSISSQAATLRSSQVKSERNKETSARDSEATKVDVSALARAAQNDPGFGDMVDILSAAANLSEKALFSLNELSKKEGAEAIDAESIKEDLQRTVKNLRARIDTADIVRENIASAGSQLEDLDAAQQRAENIGLRIQANATAAIDAHRGLDPKRVAQLLAD